MSIHHKSDAEIIATTHNMARFFTEHRQVAMILLLATFFWGWYGYHKMPKRKDPDIPVRVAAAQCQWPGATAEQVEQLVTRPMEQAAAQNTTIRPAQPVELRHPLLSFPGLVGRLHPTRRQRKGQAEGIQRHQPQAESAEPAARRRSDSVQQQLRRHRRADAHRRQPQRHAHRGRAARDRHPQGHRATRARTCQERAATPGQRHLCLSAIGGGRTGAHQLREHRRNCPAATARCKDLHFFDGPGYVGLDASTTLGRRDYSPARRAAHQEQSSPVSSCIPTPGSPPSFAIPANTEAELAKVAGAKYSYRQLDNYTDLIQRTLQGVPETSTVTRSGVLQEQIYLDYSQQRLAQYGYDPSKLKDILNAQNITLPAGSLEVGPQDLVINPSGLFPDAPPSATSSSASRRRTARSTCATWSTSRAPIRARQRS